MARIDIRLSDAEKQRLVQEAQLQGVTLSELVRQRALEGAEREDRLEALERRVNRLEELAGL